MWLFKLLTLMVPLTFCIGCGFQPLYRANEKIDIINAFSEILITPIKDRTGQLLYNELERLLQPKGRSNKTIYTLTTILNESEISLGVKKSAIATRGNLSITAQYSLKSSDGRSKIKNSLKSITVSYNIFTSPNATMTAQQDARNRAIRELAQEIRNHLGVVIGMSQKI